ncbi:hypothetical protein LguiB_028388 [Lonicera macranthoides]
MVVARPHQLPPTTARALSTAGAPLGFNSQHLRSSEGKVPKCKASISSRDFPFLSRPNELNLRRASLKARPDLVSGISKDSHGGSGGSSTSQNNGREGHDDTSGGGSSQNDRREDTDDVPVEHGENSKSPSTENQPPLAPENIDSKVKTPRALCPKVNYP